MLSLRLTDKNKAKPAERRGRKATTNLSEFKSEFKDTHQNRSNFCMKGREMTEPFDGASILTGKNVIVFMNTPPTGGAFLSSRF